MKSKISPLQFSMLMGLSSMGFIAMYQNTISFFSMIISILISFLLLIPTMIISFKEKYHIPILFRILTVIFVSLLCVMLINKYSKFFNTLINPSAPLWVISALLTIALIFPATKGIEAISRGALIFSSFVLFSLVLIFVFLPFGDMKSINCNDTSFSVNDGIDTLLIFSPIILSLFFFRNINHAKIRSVVIPFAIISLVISISMCFIKLLSITEYSYVFYPLSQLSCKIIPMGFSGLFIVLSLISVFFALLYFSLTIKSSLNNNSKIIPVVFILSVYILSLITLYSTEFSNVILNRYFLLFLYVFIALFTPVAAVIKGKSQKSKEIFTEETAENREDENA